MRLTFKLSLAIGLFTLPFPPFSLYSTVCCTIYNIPYRMVTPRPSSYKIAKNRLDLQQTTNIRRSKTDDDEPRHKSTRRGNNKSIVRCSLLHALYLTSYLRSVPRIIHQSFSYLQEYANPKFLVTVQFTLSYPSWKPKSSGNTLKSPVSLNAYVLHFHCSTFSAVPPRYIRSSLF